MMMQPFRCEICGEDYLGSAPPERCPFCGSAGKNIVPAAEWIDYGKVDMGEQSKKDCQHALELELANAAYYQCAMEHAQNQVTQTLYHRLMKHELEHAEVFATAMGIEFEEQKRKCFKEDYKNMLASNMHETMAVTFYTQVINRAPEPRIRQIFRAIADVETEHLVVTNTYIFRT